MNTIAQLVAGISAAPAPVVFLDTCAILDVARAPARAQPDAVTAAEILISLVAQTPPKVHLLVADIVATEWKDNIISARDELTKALFVFEYVAKVIGTTGIVTYPTAPPALTGLPADLEARSRALLTACRAINRDVGAANAALDRVVAKRRPSHKKEVKDSYILEHCLVVARELGGTTFQKRMLFVSSNTKDFADPGSTAVHTDLASDFATAGLGFAGTIAIAVEQLRAASQIP